MGVRILEHYILVIVLYCSCIVVVSLQYTDKQRMTLAQATAIIETYLETHQDIINVMRNALYKNGLFSLFCICIFSLHLMIKSK